MHGFLLDFLFPSLLNLKRNILSKGPFNPENLLVKEPKFLILRLSDNIYSVMGSLQRI